MSTLRPYTVAQRVHEGLPRQAHLGGGQDDCTGKAVQVDPGLKALGFQPVESTSPFKVLVSDDVNLHPYTAEASGRAPQLAALIG